MLFHDNDSKFTKAFDRDLAKRQIDVRKTAFRSPNTNAFVERFIQTIQVELLDHFVVLGQRHFNYLVKVWLEHYHTERPHQSKENELLSEGCRACRNRSHRRTMSFRLANCAANSGWAGCSSTIIARRDERGRTF